MSASQPPRLQFFATPSHSCSYVDGREATTLFADPNYPKSPQLYTLLSHKGFRRSGTHIYRPSCEHCNACIPVRVSVTEFEPRRVHRRVRTANRDLSLRIAPASFDSRHFALYQRYIAARHAGGGMDDPTPEQYRDFLTSTWSETLFFEYSLDGAVIAVAAIDQLVDALSCVYTFFDPDHSRRSLGTYAILRAIDIARRESLRWLYLGYFIADSQKMRYKAEFAPQERLVEGEWTPFV